MGPRRHRALCARHRRSRPPPRTPPSPPSPAAGGERGSPDGRIAGVTLPGGCWGI